MNRISLQTAAIVRKHQRKADRLMVSYLAAIVLTVSALVGCNIGDSGLDKAGLKTLIERVAN